MIRGETVGDLFRNLLPGLLGFPHERGKCLGINGFHDEVGPRAFPVLIEAPTPIDRTAADTYVPGEEFAYWPN